MSKMHAQLTDINNGVKVLQAPPVPPPPATGGAQGQPGSPQGNVPPMPASDLYSQAQNDRSAGKLDLALDEFSQYLKFYSDTELGGNAQFYIGWIHYSQGIAAIRDANLSKANASFDTAAAEFDTLILRFPGNVKVSTGDAYYYKGLCLKKGGKRAQSKTEFDNAIRAAGGIRDGVGKSACDEIKDMSLACPGAAPAQKKRGKQ